MRGAVQENGAIILTVPVPPAEQPAGFRKLDADQYRFGRARITVPATAGRWRLQQIRGHSFDQILNYAAQQGSGIVTLFLTRPFRADERLLWMASSHSFQANRPRPIETTAPLETATGSYRVQQIIGRASDGTQVAELLAHGVSSDGWIVKLRLTSRGASPAEALKDAGDLLGALKLADGISTHATDNAEVPPCANAAAPASSGVAASFTGKQRDEAVAAGLTLATMLPQITPDLPVTTQDRCVLASFGGEVTVTMTRLANPNAAPEYLGTFGDSGAVIMPIQLSLSKKMDWLIATARSLVFLPQTAPKVNDKVAMGVAASAEAAFKASPLSISRE